MHTMQKDKSSMHILLWLKSPNWIVAKKINEKLSNLSYMLPLPLKNALSKAKNVTDQMKGVGSMKVEYN